LILENGLEITVYENNSYDQYSFCHCHLHAHTDHW